MTAKQPTAHLARPVRHGDCDIHVLGALVVIQHGDGRVVLAIRNERRRRTR